MTNKLDWRVKTRACARMAVVAGSATLLMPTSPAQGSAGLDTSSLCHWYGSCISFHRKGLKCGGNGPIDEVLLETTDGALAGAQVREARALRSGV